MEKQARSRIARPCCGHASTSRIARPSLALLRACLYFPKRPPKKPFFLGAGSSGGSGNSSLGASADTSVHFCAGLLFEWYM